MKKYLSFVCMLFLMAGCAHGLIGALPTIDDPDEAAEIIVIRESNFMGAAVSFEILLNGVALFAIRNGEYTKFYVPSGEHSLAVKFRGGWYPSPKMKMIINVLCRPKGKYYFLVSPSLGTTAAIIEPLEDARGSYLISKSNFMPLER